MEKVLEKEKCMGCTACMNICPKQAITMAEYKDGFKYPIIDQEKCINCGLCQRTCPVLNTERNEAINKCFAAYSKDKKYSDNSSSAGIFSMIAEKFLDDEGIVIGATFDDNNKLRHIPITNKKDLIKLKGSKYLQSNLNNIFKYIKENVNDKKILFVGTPCQVAGLYAFLKGKNDNLLTIDLICHGVPSPKLYTKYISELEEQYKSKLIGYNFRDKKTGWDNYSSTAKFKDYEVSELHNDNNYMKLFLSDNTLRESCYECNFKLGNKYSDITLGDFWGIRNFDEEMYNKDGVSAIIINTNKGETIFNTIKNEIEYKECCIDDITSRNKSLIESAKMTDRRKKFYEDIDNFSIEELTKKYKGNISIYQKIKNKLKKVINKI